MLLIDTGYITRVLQDLVRINSVNPRLDPSAPGEAEIAAYVADALRALGLEVAVHEPQPGRASVVGRLRGSRAGRSLMFNAHADTVDVGGMDAPFSGEIRDGRLYGRGAFDMKGGLAAMMGAVKALADAGRPHGGEILLAAVADEEYASLGTEDLVTRYRPDAAIVTEPTALDICLAHKGFAWFEVTTRGRAAHGSRFDLGVDANMHMGRVLADLDALEKDLRARIPHRLVGPPSLHAATLAGGSALSTYAASCRLQIERRTIPGERRDAVAGEIRAMLERQSARDASFEAAFEELLVREPFEVAEDAAIVRALTDASTAVLGRRPAYVGQTPWMDAALLAGAGAETVVMGATGAGAHAMEEWVDLASVHQLAACLAEAAVRYC
ncbi:MAG TPA: ArgE/DapE family deacylase [Vicinamibacterales bacterium]|nr:ArgE/DapE family deacylase [Vicinamibacterales bacterium]